MWAEIQISQFSVKWKSFLWKAFKSYTGVTFNLQESEKENVVFLFHSFLSLRRSLLQKEEKRIQWQGKLKLPAVHSSFWVRSNQKDAVSRP